MLKATYDSDDDGVVDDASKLGGQAPAYYQKSTDNTLQTDNKTVTGAINEVYGMAQNGGKNLIGEDFSSEKSYTVGKHVINGNSRYRFIVDHPAGPWDASHVEEIPVDKEMEDLNEKIEEKPIIFSEFPGISANLSQNFVVKNKRVTGSATFTTASTNGWRYTFMTINNTDLVLDGFLVSPSGTILPIVIEDGSGMKWIKFGDYAVAQGAAYTVYLL